VVARRVCSRSERAWAPARRDVTSRGIARLSALGFWIRSLEARGNSP
jgi:hypothetical protein